MQETFARGLLMPYVVPSYSHKKENIDFAIECIRDALLAMKNAAEGNGMKAALLGEPVKPVFRKYN
jgi:glutamate-1-semialdehyde 2,1-aminomutase